MAELDAVEERIAAMMAELLGQPTVARDDHFFYLGGHSLAAARLMARVRSAFGADVPLRRFIAEPTAAGLAAAVRETGSGSAAAPNVRRNARAARVFDVADLDGAAPGAAEEEGDR